MARKIVHELIDDLDPTMAADETVSFGLDGRNYEIDLTDAHAKELRGALAEFVEAARQAGGRAKAKTRTATSATNGDSRAIREWALANGHNISSRGRIPANVVDAYHASA